MAMRLDIHDESWGREVQGIRSKISLVRSEYDRDISHRIKLSIKNVSMEPIPYIGKGITHEVAVKLESADGRILTRWEEKTKWDDKARVYDFLPCRPALEEVSNRPVESNLLAPGEELCDSFHLENVFKSYPRFPTNVLPYLTKERTFLVAQGAPCFLRPRLTLQNNLLPRVEAAPLISNLLELRPLEAPGTDEIEVWPFPPEGMLAFMTLLPPASAVVAEQRTKMTLVLKNVVPRPMAMPSADVFKTNIFAYSHSPNGIRRNAGVPTAGLRNSQSEIEWGIEELGQPTFAPLEQREYDIWFVFPLKGKWEIKCVLDVLEEHAGPFADSYRGRIESNAVKFLVE